MKERSTVEIGMVTSPGLGEEQGLVAYSPLLMQLTHKFASDGQNWAKTP